MGKRRRVVTLPAEVYEAARRLLAAIEARLDQGPRAGEADLLISLEDAVTDHLDRAGA